MPDIRRDEEPCGVGIDEQLLVAGRRRAPDREPTVAVMVVEQHEEAFLLANEERGRAVARTLARLRKPQANARQPFQLLLTLGCARVVHVADRRRRRYRSLKRAVSSAGRASALHAEGRRFEPCTAHMAVEAAQVSLLRWLRRQLRQPNAIREHLEAAVENDDPAEARRLVARFPFSDAQRRNVEQLLDAWDRRHDAP